MFLVHLHIENHLILKSYFFLGAKGLSFIATERPAIRSYKCSQILQSQRFCIHTTTIGAIRKRHNSLVPNKSPQTIGQTEPQFDNFNQKMNQSCQISTNHKPKPTQKITFGKNYLNMNFGFLFLMN